MTRLTDDDRTLGPLTWGRAGWRAFGISIAGEDTDYGYSCHLGGYAFGWAWRLSLPPLIPPFRRKVIAGSWDAATVARLGRNWYYDSHRREYGFRFSGDGFLQVFLGAQTHDSTTTQDWSWFLPWKQWRHVRHSIYGVDGEHLFDESAYPNWLDFHKAKEAVPARSFLLEDYDGVRIVATTRIEEREWRFGDKWCSWLSIFRKPKINRTLDIHFSSEVGPEKGSWKGGTVGTGIDMLPGELHEAAFRRFCEGEHPAPQGRRYRVKYVGPRGPHEPIPPRVCNRGRI